MKGEAWWRRPEGWVRFETEGGLAGRFLALAAGEGIPLWDTRRGELSFSACCRAGDYPRLRPVARRCGMRLKLKERHGLAFRLRRYRARPGLAAGLAVYAVLLAFFSTRIWAVEFRGLDRADRGELEALLAAHGVAVGAPKAPVDSETVRLDALGRLKDVTWLAVNLEGTVATVEVEETNPGEAPLQGNAPSDLVAARDGLVLAVEIIKGRAAVKPGEGVAAGSLLAAGIAGTEEEPILCRSSGRVIAETRRELAVCVPLREALLLPAGEGAELPELRLFGISVPLYDSDISPEGCRVETFTRMWSLGGVTLPVGVTMRRYTPLALQEVTRTREEAERLAREKLAEQVADLPEGLEILERQETVTEEGDRFTITLSLRCREDIALEVPVS